MIRNAGTLASHNHIAVDFRTELGNLLQKQRQRLGLSQARAAELANLSMKYVGEIERGEANISLDVLSRLAAALSWNPIEVLNGSPALVLITEAERLIGRLETMVQRLRGGDPQAIDQIAPKPRGRPRRKLVAD